MSSAVRPMRAAFTEQAYAIGGAEVNLLALVSRIDRSLIEPTVICRKQGPLTEALSAAGCKWEIVKLPPMGSVSIRLAGRKTVNPAACIWDALSVRLAASMLARHLRARGYDLVCTIGLFAHLYGGLAAANSGIPCVWHLQDIVSRSRAGGLFRLALRSCAKKTRPAIISISEPVTATLAGLGLAIYEIPNAVDCDLYAQADGSALRMELGIGEQTLTVGVVGRVTPWKGQLEFVRAAAQVGKKIADVHFLIVGEASANDRWYLNAVEQEALLSGCGDRIHFIGFRDDVPSVMHCLNLLVLPSTEPEPFGRVVIEAMASGRPVIATDHGGVVQIIEQGVTGEFVPPGDVDRLAGAITSLLERPELLHSMGARARQEALDRFPMNGFVEQVTTVLLSASRAAR